MDASLLKNKKFVSVNVPYSHHCLQATLNYWPPPEIYQIPQNGTQWNLLKAKFRWPEFYKLIFERLYLNYCSTKFIVPRVMILMVKNWSFLCFDLWFFKCTQTIALSVPSTQSTKISCIYFYTFFFVTFSLKNCSFLENTI